MSTTKQGDSNVGNKASFGERVKTVGMATRYGLDGPVIESRWGRDFPHLSRPSLGPTQPPIQWLPVLFPRVKRPGRGVNHLHTHLKPRLKKEYRYPLLPLRAFVFCSRVNFTFTFTTPRQSRVEIWMTPPILNFGTRWM